MNPHDLIKIGTAIEVQQNDALDQLTAATPRISKQEHIIRAVSDYLKKPAIQEALKAAPPSTDV